MAGPDVPVLTAVTGAAWESTLVASLDHPAQGVHVVRRCVDLADLLAAASAGRARVALLSADLRRLDRDALVRLGSAGVAVVGVVTPGDEDAERRLRQLGVSRVVAADVPVDRLVAVVRAAGAGDARGHDGRPRDAGRSVLADPRAALAGEDVHAPRAGAGGWGSGWDAGDDAEDLGAPDPGVEPGAGRLVAVWGPTGAPGRSTLAVTLASEAAALGTPTLLADADTYGGVVAQLVGLLDEAPGLAAAVRAAGTGRLDVPGLARHARQLTPALRVLTGIARAERWLELRPAALELVWETARSLVGLTVVDCGFSLERDEELSFDTAAPRRNGATLTTLEAADVVVAVGSADPVGMHRLVRGLQELREVVPDADVRVVVNRVRASVVGSRPEAQLRDVLERYAGVADAFLLPDDPRSCDRTLLHGRTLVEAVPDAPLRRAVAPLVADLVRTPEPAAAGAASPGGSHRRR